MIYADIKGLSNLPQTVNKFLIILVCVLFIIAVFLAYFLSNSITRPIQKLCMFDVLKSIPETQVLAEKDYASNPKKSGYRSFHLIMEIPVFYSEKTEVIPVEIQLRTAAMDFWATLEHKARYKYNEHIPAHLSDELSICAEKIAELDNRMFLVHDITRRS